MIALTHVPTPNLYAGERTYIDHQPIDHAQALRQHAAYCDTLAKCGWDVRRLTHQRELADATFIEDTAVVLDEVAVLASMGAASRAAEPSAIAPLLREWREVRQIEPPALLEGGDVLRIGRQLLVGRSRRTNAAGIELLADIVRPFGYRVASVAVTGCLHLKTAVCALPDGRLLVNSNWIAQGELRDYACVAVADHESFAANILLSGQTVTMDASHQETIRLLRRDFDVRPVTISEFAKAEGGVTCLSLLIT